MPRSSTTDSGTATAERVVRKPPFGAPHVCVLAVVEGEEPSAVYRLNARETVVGRGPRADFVVDDHEISKRHLVFTLDGAVCKVSDAGSTNGTRVNGRELRAGVAQRLRHLDEIDLGGTRLLFLRGRFTVAPAKV